MGSWLCTDRDTLDLFQTEDWASIFSQLESVDVILAEHVLEHLTPLQCQSLAAISFLYLKPGGVFRIAVPDGYRPDPEYQRHAAIGSTPSGLGNNHMVFWTQDTLPPIFRSIGFDIVLQEYHDVSGKFHQGDHAYENESTLGVILRSYRHDRRNNRTYTKLMRSSLPKQPGWHARANTLRGFTSLWFDAVKPQFYNSAPC